MSQSPRHTAGSRRRRLVGSMDHKWTTGQGGNLALQQVLLGASQNYHRMQMLQRVVEFKGWLNPEHSLGLPSPVPDPIGRVGVVYLLFMLVELAVSVAKGVKVYSLRQTVNNLSGSVLHIFTDILSKALHVVPHHYLNTRFGLITYGEEYSWWHHVLFFLLLDIAFYWHHRLVHDTNLGWAAHQAHHSSPDLNLATALRLSAWEEQTMLWISHLPLALLCPVDMVALHDGINHIWQFFLHNQLVPKLWWPIEFLFNTPSHHRVHHARNYGRRNFGGVLIIWDRYWGSFEEESEDRPPVFGLNTQNRPLGTYNIFKHQFDHLWCTLRLALSQGPRLFLQALFTRKPGPGMVLPTATDRELERCLPAELAPASATGAAVLAAPEQLPPEQAAGAGKAPHPAKGTSVKVLGKWDQRPLGLLDYYATAHFFGCAIPISLFMLHGVRHVVTLLHVGSGAWAVLTVYLLNELLEGSAQAVRWELLRLVVQAVLIQLAGASSLVPPGEAYQLGAWAAASLTWASALLLWHQLRSMSTSDVDAPSGKRKGE